MNAITAGLTARDMRKGRYAQAVQRVEKHVKKKPTDAAGYLLLAHCHFSVGDYSASLTAARSGLKIEPDNECLLVKCARSADAAGHEQEAYDFAGRLLDLEFQLDPIPYGILKWFRPIEKRIGVSFSDTLARVNRDRIIDYDWAKRYRRKFEARQTDS